MGVLRFSLSVVYRQTHFHDTQTRQCISCGTLSPPTVRRGLGAENTQTLAKLVYTVIQPYGIAGL